MTNRLADSSSPNKRMPVGDISLVLTRSISPPLSCCVTSERYLWRPWHQIHLGSNSAAKWPSRLDCQPASNLIASQRTSNFNIGQASLLKHRPLTHSLISDPKLRKRPFDLCFEDFNKNQICVLSAYFLSHDWPGFEFNIGLLRHFVHLSPCHLNHPPSLDLLISIRFGRNTCTKTHLINVGSQTKFSLSRLCSLFTHPLFVGFLLLL